MRCAMKPTPVPSPGSQCPASTDSEDESLDDHRSIASTENTRVQPMEMPMKTRKDGSVRVAVRIRPMLPRELAQNAATCVSKPKGLANSIVLSDGIERTFTFDHAFPQSTGQAELYEEALDPWMASFLQGFNVTVIAYGQTGSGKTHTMGNHMPINNLFVASPSIIDSHDEAADVLDSAEGLIPRFLYHLFSKLKECGSNHQLSVSFLEIYGEDIHDLLNKSGDIRRSELLQLRENKNGVWVQGLTEVCVSTRQEALEQMRRGSLQRITASTLMNERSSRSHAVYTVKIIQRVREQKYEEKSSNMSNQRYDKDTSHTTVNLPSDEDAEADAVIVSKLTFVDLAGSERLKKTRAEGERMKEGIQINVGLFALGNVINALGDDNCRSDSHKHVPYRSSKLTRLLQDALGGNSRTLFIACVSPADYNVNETLNTLQYANRAKNIQNKAVKNIDSRSVEIVHLKAFNQVLCRELVKAILGEKNLAHIETRMETYMMDPKVLAYLNKLQQLSASAGLEASSDECLYEVQRLVHRLTTYLHNSVPCKVMQRTYFSTSSNEGKAGATQPQDESIDFISDSGSSVAILEDHILDSEEAYVTLYPLQKLCRTLEIINFALEMQEIQNIGKQQNNRLKAKLNGLETRYHRRELLRDGLVGTIEKMQTYYAAFASDEASDIRSTIKSNLNDAVEKLELLNSEILKLQQQKDTLTQELGAQIARCQKNWKAKQAQIECIRETPEKAITNALDVMTRKNEIKVHFDGYDLNSIAEFLKEEENQMLTFIEEEDAELSLISPLFSREELSLSHTCNIWSMIQDQLRIAFDREALEASMCKELRKRTQLIQNITTGLRACNCGEMSEQEFMEKNEKSLKDCEDCISQLRDAMHAKQSQRASMSEILDSIKSLDVAKDVIKRLIVENYSQWRIRMACDEEDNMRKQREAEEGANRSLAGIKVAMAKKIEDLEAKYVKDVQRAFQMAASLNEAVKSGVHLENAAEAQAACDMAAVNEREKLFARQLAEKEEQLATIQADLKRSQALAKSVEVNEEPFRLMSRCQDIWKELGVDEDAQASKFQDIKELLIKKCSEELKGLEAARESLQARINDKYCIVHRLESVLHEVGRVEISLLSSVAGPTLLEQEKYLHSRQEHLSYILWQRLKAFTRIYDGIRGLVAELQVKTMEDFRHFSVQDADTSDVEVIRSALAEPIAWKNFLMNKDDTDALVQALDNLGDGANISTLSRQRNEHLLKTLHTEKAERIVELDHLSKAIRTMAKKSHLSREDVECVITALRDANSEEVVLTANGRNVFDELCAWIFQTGGRLDVSKKALEILENLLMKFQEIEAGRSAAFEFLRKTLEEATMLLHDIHVGDGLDEGLRQLLHQFTDDMRHNAIFTDSLGAGKKILIGLREPVQHLLRNLLFSTNDAFAAYGIDTVEHQISFFLGSKDEKQSARRAILERYAVRSTNVITAPEESDKAIVELCKDTFLSKIDPAFGEYNWVYSASFGELQLKRLRDSIADVYEVQRTVESAQKRLGSLQKIMKIFTKINEFKVKIAEFESSASQKKRLFGNSVRLLEEERFRKLAAKHYPNLLASLRKEVTRWLKNEDGEFNLGVLGEDLKELLLDMMNTDTGLMHLDLGIVQRSAKQSLTQSLSSSNLQTETTGRVFTPARAQSAHNQAL